MENENQNELIERSIVSVASTDDGNYKVIVAENSSVEEVAFAIGVIIKVFNRDDVISKDNMLELINKYLNDVQYEEVQS